MEFVNAYGAVLIDIEEFERFFERESLVLEEGLSGIFKLTVLADVKLNHSQEHKVLELTLFLCLLSLLLLLTNLCLSKFLLMSDPLLLSLDLLVNLVSLLLGCALFLVTFLLTLSRGKIVGGSSSTFLCCTVVLFTRGFLRSLFLFLLSSVEIFNTVVELLFFAARCDLLSSVVSGRRRRRRRVAGDLLTEFAIADDSVSIVVTSSQDCLLICAQRVELV